MAQLPCVFCYKPVKNADIELDSKFSKLFSRFVRQELNIRQVEYRKHGLLNSCDDCQVLVSLFCNQYHKLECIELQLQWTLERLLNIIKLASRVPSRLLSAKRMLCDFEFDNECDFETSNEKIETQMNILKTYRHTFAKNCTAKFLQSKPRVKLNDINAASPRIVLPDLEKRESDSFLSPLPLHYFLGWITSIVAVTLLTLELPHNISQIFLDILSPLSVSLTDKETPDSEETMNGTDEMRQPFSSVGPIPSPELVVDAHVNEILDEVKDATNLDLKSPSEVGSETSFTNATGTGNSVNDTPELKSNIEISKAQEDIICKFCKQGFKTKHRLNKHIKFTHKQPLTNNYKCAICKRTFLRYDLLRLHKLHSKCHHIVKRTLNKKSKMLNQSKKCTTNTEMVIADNLKEETKDDGNFSDGEPSHDINETEVKYNLREERKRYYIKMEIENNQLSDHDYQEDSASSSDTSCSESEGNSLNRKTSGARNARRVRGKRKWTYCCKKDGCKFKFTGKNPKRRRQNHEKLHGNFQCTICTVSKEYAPDLAVHEFEQHNPTSSLPSNKLKCSRCAFEFSHKRQFIRHFLITHLNLNSDVETTSKCPICQTAIVRYNINKHKRKQHGKPGMDPSEFKQCFLCPAYFVTCKQLIKHKCKVHWQNKCPNCQVNFSHCKDPRLRLGLHIEKCSPKHMPHLTLPCENPSCCRRFSTKAELEEHLKSNKCENLYKYICSICGAELGTQKCLNSHIRKTHGDRSFICDECGKKFQNKPTLEQHKEFHKNPEEWKWECTECGRKFATRQKLDQHKRTHTKEKLYICQYCGVKYAHRHNWKNHVITKHPEKQEELGLHKRQNRNYLSRKGSKKGDRITAKVQT